MSEKTNMLSEQERSRLESHRSHSRIRRLGDRAARAVASGPSIRRLEEKERLERLGALGRSIENIDEAIDIAKHQGKKYPLASVNYWFPTEPKKLRFHQTEATGGPVGTLLFELEQRAGHSIDLNKFAKGFQGSMLATATSEQQVSALRPPLKPKIDPDYYMLGAASVNVAAMNPDPATKSETDPVHVLMLFGGEHAHHMVNYLVLDESVAADQLAGVEVAAQQILKRSK